MLFWCIAHYSKIFRLGTSIFMLNSATKYPFYLSDSNYIQKQFDFFPIFLKHLKTQHFYHLQAQICFFFFRFWFSSHPDMYVQRCTRFAMTLFGIKIHIRKSKHVQKITIYVYRSRYINKIPVYLLQFYISAKYI